jgi:hypothetical protein
VGRAGRFDDGLQAVLSSTPREQPGALGVERQLGPRDLVVVGGAAGDPTLVHRVAAAEHSSVVILPSNRRALTS